ncbi:MAG TPA: hypothetical protein GXZ51_00845 [Acholeplasma sp.]|jgi:hypothetical protein|nr:hypothetical protein [Acholeplasma sp.]
MIKKIIKIYLIFIVLLLVGCNQKEIKVTVVMKKGEQVLKLSEPSVLNVGLLNVDKDEIQGIYLDKNFNEKYEFDTIRESKKLYLRTQEDFENTCQHAKKLILKVFPSLKNLTLDKIEIESYRGAYGKYEVFYIYLRLIHPQSTNHDFTTIGGLDFASAPGYYQFVISDDEIYHLKQAYEEKLLTQKDLIKIHAYGSNKKYHKIVINFKDIGKVEEKYFAEGTKINKNWFKDNLRVVSPNNEEVNFYTIIGFYLDENYQNVYQNLGFNADLNLYVKIMNNIAYKNLKKDIQNGVYLNYLESTYNEEDIKEKSSISNYYGEYGGGHVFLTRFTSNNINVETPLKKTPKKIDEFIYYIDAYETIMYFKDNSGYTLEDAYSNNLISKLDLENIVHIHNTKELVI